MTSSLRPRSHFTTLLCHMSYLWFTQKPIAERNSPPPTTTATTETTKFVRAILFVTLFRMVIAVTTDQMLLQGLRFVGFDTQQVQNVSLSLNLRRFKSHYGSHPIVYVQMWTDLQTTPCLDALVDSKTINLIHYLMTLHFLKCYPTEEQLAASFKVGERSVRKWCRYYGRKMQALKQQKVSRSAWLMLFVHAVS